MASDLQPRCSRLKTTELMKKREGGGGITQRQSSGFTWSHGWCHPARGFLPRDARPGSVCSPIPKNTWGRFLNQASLFLPYFSTCSLQLQPPSEALAKQGDSLIRQRFPILTGLKPSRHQTQNGQGDQEKMKGAVFPLPLQSGEINTTFPVG